MQDKLIELAKPIINQECQSFLDHHPDRQRIMQSVTDHGGFEAHVDQISNALVTAMHKSLPHDGLYITSFCGESKDEYINENGLLSQWRGYGSGGGFALVFKTLDLEEMLVEEAERFDYAFGQLADVVYSDDEERFRCEFTSQLSRMRRYIRAMIRGLLVRKLDPAIENGNEELPAFISCISRYKHRGFKEENEVRICAYPTAHSEDYLDSAKAEGIELKPEKARKFRERDGERIPYIELFSSLTEDLPIKRIIVGPHKNKESRAKALKAMLRNSRIEITVSDIPFTG